ncbi:uncharacterized protein Tco025E_04426 [Trypanosoma conorhini]|uniref:Uncharacterized protein n=1 Tax=Trypanosoma conorhini TaxID=83891 RepID=A0A3R7L2T9_9TRYP|nr:uncharacterized protein Tco025E_04426 [Trypanosoma conorhini]RNF18552.1 hypothetical protein Tco025E_04426 [Trypanosoma conorhini]
MDTLAYVCRERNANAVRFEVPLISVKANAFGDEVPALMSSHRRLLCMNVKQPNRLRVLYRQGKYVEAEVGAPVLRHLVSSEGHLDYCAFFAVGGESVSRLKPVNYANGETKILLQEVNLQEELYGVAVGSGETAYALGKAHIFEVDMEAATKKATMDLASKTLVRYPVIGYHHEAKLLLAPAKQNCLDLISTDTRKSILPKVWEPHGGSVPTAAFFLQRRGFANESAGNVFIVTATCGNTELRLWCYNKTKQTFSLMQDLCISVETDADTTEANKEEESFLISCTATEEYITLCSKRHSLAVVVELHRSNFKVDRVTSWKLQGPAIASVAMVGKVAESALSGSVAYQLMLGVRTASGFFEEVLDVEKLVGASNTATMKQNSVAKWFPQHETEGNVIAAKLPTALTAVSSSVLGDKTTNAVSQAMASRIVRQQASQFCDKLRSIDERVVDLQKRASEAMRLFQETRAREEAQTIGRKFATRNKGRLELLQQQQQEQQEQSLAVESPETLNASQQEFLDQIHAILEEVDPGAAESAESTVKAVLTQRLKDAVAKGAKEAEQMDLGIVVPTIRSTDSMRVFSNGTDSAMRVLIRAIKDHHALMQAPLKASTNASAECITKAREFGASIKHEMKKLSEELNETKNAVSQLSVVAVPVAPDVLVSRAVAAAEANDWTTAFNIALAASDIAVLLGFLQNEVCTENMSTITRPQAISLTAFLSLCLQLSFELNSQPELIPLRIQIMDAFYVEWDDALKEIKQKATEDASEKNSLFELSKQELGRVLEPLSGVDDSVIDRRSRNRLRLLRRLIGSFLA